MEFSDQSIRQCPPDVLPRTLAPIHVPILSSIWNAVVGNQPAQPANPVLHLDAEPFGLRTTRFFHSPSVYYVGITIDFLLRCAPWGLRAFSPSFHQWFTSDLEIGVFAMQALEIFRRWLWIFLRVETEWVRMEQKPSLGGVSISSIAQD